MGLHEAMESHFDSIPRFEETKKSPYGYVDFGCSGGGDIAYIGGHFNPITVIGSKSKQGFVGCLQQVYINTVRYTTSFLQGVIPLSIYRLWCKDKHGNNKPIRTVSEDNTRRF